jgi:hypothetical protein
MGIISWVVGQGIGKIPLVGWAYSLTELIKSQVDDHTRKQLEVIRKAEGCSHILDCCSYSMMAGQGINAMTIASVGMTAWEAPNLLWVYHKQPDFKPIHAR